MRVVASFWLVYVRDFGRRLAGRLPRLTAEAHTAAAPGIYFALLRSFFFWGVLFCGCFPAFMLDAGQREPLCPCHLS